MKKQSAFSLIEVLIALLILSIGVIGASEMLLKSTICYQKAELEEVATTIAWSIADSLYMDKRGVGVAQLTQYWQEKLEKVFPGSSLTIQQQTTEEKCVYTITIQFVTQPTRPFKFSLVV